MQTPLGRSARKIDLQMRPVRCVHEDHQMSKEDALKTMMLLSALESWAFSQQNRLPDYLVDDIQRSLEVLEKIVLEKQA
jgi:hypothetical protein